MRHTLQSGLLYNHRGRGVICYTFVHVADISIGGISVVCRSSRVDLFLGLCVVISRKRHQLCQRRCGLRFVNDHLLAETCKHILTLCLLLPAFHVSAPTRLLPQEGIEIYLDDGKMGASLYLACSFLLGGVNLPACAPRSTYTKSGVVACERSLKYLGFTLLAVTEETWVQRCPS